MGRTMREPWGTVIFKGNYVLFFYRIKRESWGYSVVVECLPSVSEAQGSIPSTAENKTKHHTMKR